MAEMYEEQLAKLARLNTEVSRAQAGVSVTGTEPLIIALDQLIMAAASARLLLLQERSRNVLRG